MTVLQRFVAVLYSFVAVLYSYVTVLYRFVAVIHRFYNVVSVENGTQLQQDSSGEKNIVIRPELKSRAYRAATLAELYRVTTTSLHCHFLPVTWNNAH